MGTPDPLGSYTEFGQQNTLFKSPGTIAWKLTTISGGRVPITVVGGVRECTRCSFDVTTKGGDGPPRTTDGGPGVVPSL